MLLDSKNWPLRSGKERALDLTGILWPSLGYPLIIDVQSKVVEASVLLSLPEEAMPPLSQVKGQLRLVSRLLEAPVTIDLLSASRVALADLDNIGRWAPWVQSHSPTVICIKFAFTAPKLHRKVNLYDIELEYGKTIFKKHSAVALRSPSDIFQIALATDIHVATRWDDIEEGLSQFYSDDDISEALTHVSLQEMFSRKAVRNTFINPNRNLSWFIRAVNELALRGDLDAVVLSGDLIDFKYSQERKYSGTSFEDTEWKLFKDIVLGATKHGPRLELPLFTSTGNHDYRLYPYRVRTYGLYHAGLPDEITEPYFQSINQWGKLKYSYSDLDSLRVNTGVSHSLDYYFREFNPCLDYEVTLGGVEFLILDTGPDAMTDVSHLAEGRVNSFFRSAIDISHPPSNGLDSKQIEFARQWFQQIKHSTAVVITHAPVIMPSLEAMLSSVRGKEDILQIPQVECNNANIKNFEQVIHSKELSKGGLFRNQLSLFRFLQEHCGQIALFSGHCHTDSKMLLNKATGTVSLTRTLTLAESMENQALLFHTPSLAHYETENLLDGNISYRIVSLSDKRIQDVRLAPVLESPLDEWIYDWICVKEDESTERFDFTFLNRVKKDKIKETNCRIVLRFTGKAFSEMKVITLNPAVVIESKVEFQELHNAYASWVITNTSPFQIKLINRPSGTKVSFLYEIIDKEKRVGLRWHFRSYS